MTRKITQEPDTNGGHEDKDRPFSEGTWLPAPTCAAGRSRRRNPVRRQFHDERRIISSEKESSQQFRRNDSHYDTQQIKAEQHRTGMGREEDAGQQHKRPAAVRCTT